MIERAALVADCQRLLGRMETDVREWTLQDEKLTRQLKAEHAQFRRNKRTASTFESWLDEEVTQAAASWVLACVFVRFMEDNDLIAQPYIAGPTGAEGGEDRLERAQQYRSAYFQENPADSDRNYLQYVFREVGKIAACRDLFAEDRNPLWRLSVSGDGAGELMRFWQQIDPDTGRLVRDFVTDDVSDTRFLGDLYQDLSEAAKKKYALLQTPEFVEEFILDYTLDPAIETFGLEGFRMIDPACGSGHFVLGSFRRLLARWGKHAPPGAQIEDVVRRALQSVHGVDLNPFAVAIARFRLMVAALVACGRKHLGDVPAFPLHLAVGDSLLMGAIRGHRQALMGSTGEGAWGPDYLVQGDYEEATRILSQRYHAVVANPPYITVKDKAVSQACRNRYKTCYRQYSLAMPFMERIYDLACDGGFTGQITSNSFMKREFGKRLVEEFMPVVDLTHMIDTSGAYLPGFGTPTVILFGRKRPPVSKTVRTVMGIKGEPATPAEPAKGQVWSAILDQVGRAGSKSDFVSVADTSRNLFARHPWSIGGGGAAELKASIDEHNEAVLGPHAIAIGRGMHTSSDDSYFASSGTWRRFRVERTIPVVEGEVVRDWRLTAATETVFPYDEELRPLADSSDLHLIRLLWRTKQMLVRRREPNGTHAEIGLTWYEWSRFQRERYLSPLSIAFPHVATHNHFVLDRGGKVFNRSAPVIKLPERATEHDHLSLLGLLNSSTASFWMKQVLHNKGSTVDQAGARQRTAPFEDFFDHDSSKLEQFPLAAGCPVEIARRLDALAIELSEALPAAAMARAVADAGVLREAEQKAQRLLGEMIAWQEELDWECYGLYGLLDDPPRCEVPPLLELGQRAFEIVLARLMAAGEEETTWFERHGSTPITELPEDWPAEYHAVVEKRIELIETNPDIALIERPEYKRRWNTEPWEDQQRRALCGWLCNRLEDGRYWPTEPVLQSCRQLAEKARRDDDFMQVAALYRERDNFDVARLVQELVEAEAVPYLPVLRYKDSGLRKRRQWEEVWDLQRREDAGEKVDIPVPPRYTSKDFRSTTYWKRRGKLDVPKERFVSYPGAERAADGTPVVTWAGYDHAEQARALATYYHRVKDEEGWPADRLVPLLAGIDQLVPWVKQWHNEVDPGFGVRLGDYFEEFVRTEAHALDKTLEEIRAWQPPKTKSRRRKRR